MSLATAAFAVDLVKVAVSFERREAAGPWYVAFEVDRGDSTSRAKPSKTSTVITMTKARIIKTKPQQVQNTLGNMDRTPVVCEPLRKHLIAEFCCLAEHRN